MLIGYTRISTNSESQSTDLQKDALISYGVDNRNIFEDKISGSRENRPGLKSMLEYIKEGDTLVVWKLDRLGRSLSHLIEIMKIINEKNVKFVSLTEGIDTTTSMGNMLFNLFGLIAEYEHSIIRERIIAGIESAKVRGRRGGRPRIISEEKLSKIKESINNGMPKSEVCRIYGVKRGALFLALKR